MQLLSYFSFSLGLSLSLSISSTCSLMRRCCLSVCTYSVLISPFSSANAFLFLSFFLSFFLAQKKKKKSVQEDIHPFSTILIYGSHEDIVCFKNVTVPSLHLSLKRTFPISLSRTHKLPPTISLSDSLSQPFTLSPSLILHSQKMSEDAWAKNPQGPSQLDYFEPVIFDFFFALVFSFFAANMFSCNLSPIPFTE